MKDILSALRSRPNRVYAVIFGLLISGAALLYFLASAGNDAGTLAVLGLLVLANLLVVAF